MKRAHFQAAQWIAALRSDPPRLGPWDYDWEADEVNKSLPAMPEPAGVTTAPDNVLWLIPCGCQPDTACKTEPSMYRPTTSM